MNKRVLSVMLALCLLIMFLPLSAQAEILYSGTCGEDLTWTLDTEGVMRITGTGYMDDYPIGNLFSMVSKVYLPDSLLSIGDGAFQYFTGLKEIVIPEGVSKIGDRAFMGCIRLTSVTLPDSLTTLGDAVFLGCEQLSSITLPNSLSTLGDAVFGGCEQLTSISLPNSVTALGDSAFLGCDKLTSIILPDSLVSLGDAAFKGCSHLVSVTLPNSLTRLGKELFCMCTSLPEITIPDSITHIEESAFAECSTLKEIIIPDSVVEMGSSVFTGCRSLQRVTLSNSITAIPASLFGKSSNGSCGNLTEITIPDSVETIGRSAFEDCSNLKQISMPDSVKEIHPSAFKNCGSLTAINIPEDVYSIGENAFAGCAKIESLDFSQKITTIPDGVCTGCTTLTAVTIPKTVTSIGNGAFEDCPALSTITYGGSVMMWEETEKGENNGALNTATMHYAMGDHVHDYALVVIPPTCTEYGYTTYSCICGDTYADSPTEPLKHKWGKPQVVGTSEGGDVIICTLICENCGKSETRRMAEAWHIHTYMDTVIEPTCTEKGYTYRACTSCDNWYHDSSVDPLGHDFVEGECSRCHCSDPGWNPDEVNCDHSQVHNTYVSATCTGCSYLISVCKNCYSDFTMPTSFGGLGHTITDGKCTRCGETVSPTVSAPTEPDPYAPHTHSWDAGTITVLATCTTKGTIIYKCECGTIRTDATDVTDHTFSSGKCTSCGMVDPDWSAPTEPAPTEPTPTEPEPTDPAPTDPAPTEPSEEQPRLAGSNRFETANLVGDQIKANLGIEKFDAVVVASGTDFADALAGSYLASAKKAPILLAYNDKINEGVKDYIKANLNPGGTVYILGGEKAVPESFKDGLEEQFTVNRLAGGNRFETNLLVLQEAGVGDKPILVCTGLDFADSLSASATKLPILLVYGNKLLPEQAAFMESVKGRELYIIGGEGAVSTNMENALTAYGTVDRVAGGNRFETSVMIAEKFFTAPESAVLAYAWGFPDGLCGGPLAATMNAPLILTMDKYESKAAEYIQSKGIASGTILGGEKLIPESSINKIFP